METNNIETPVVRDDDDNFVLNYIYPIYPLRILLGNMFGYVGVSLSLLLAMMPILLGLMLWIVNNGGAGEGNIVTLIVMLIFTWVTANNESLVSSILLICLAIIYLLGYLQLIIGKLK